MIQNYQNWKKRNLLVLKMMTTSNLVETSLQTLGIPFIEYDCVKETNLASKWEKDKELCCGVIITGSLTDDDLKLDPSFPLDIIENLPVLGICYGHEFIGEILGAEIVECNPPVGEFGPTKVDLLKDELFKGLDIKEDWIVTMRHDKMLKELPNGAKLIAKTDLTPIAGFHHKEKRYWGIQFHPEKDWLKDVVFKNFYEICR